MVKKRKNKKKEKDIKLNTNTKWIIILVVITVFVIFNVLGTRSLLKSVLSKLRPTPTPTPTKIVNISPPEGLNRDQAVYVKQAVEVLAAKLKIKTEDIKVVSVKAKQWNDSSLGCPQKGYMYIQSITEGYIIELLYQGKSYYYNAGLNRVVSC